MPEVRAKSVAELIDKAFDDGLGMDEMVTRFRNSVVVHALNRKHGNICHAADLLKTHRNNLARWMDEFNLHGKDFRNGNGNPSK